MLPPSIITHTVGGIFLVWSIGLLILYLPVVRSLDAYRLIVLLMLVSITITLHGLSHVAMEKVYNYNPWFMLYRKST